MANTRNIGTAFAAAAVGALAGAAAVMLSNPKNRRQVSKHLHDLKQDAGREGRMAERKVRKVTRKLKKQVGGDN